MAEEDAEQLVVELCTVAGMLMEAAVPTALFRPTTAEDMSGNLTMLSAVATDVAALIHAAEVVARRRCSL